MTAIFAVLWTPAAIAGELRDPTRPPLSAPRPAGPVAAAPVECRLPVLMATMVAPERRLAVLDGQTVIEGETIGGAQLVRVGPGVAVLRQGGREFTVRLAAAEGSGFLKSAREEKR